MVRSRLHRDLLDAIDAYAAEEGIERAEAVRRALRDWAIAHGYLEHPPDKEDAN